MAFGRKSIWVGIVGLTVTVTGVAVAANAGSDAGDAPVEAAAPVTEAISEVDDLVDAAVEGAQGLGAVGALPEPTTTTTTAPPTTTTAPPPPPTTAAPAPQPTAPPATQAAPPPPPPTTAPPPPPPSVANRDTGCESYMYNQINANRSGNLSFDTGIQYIAVNWSDHMSSGQNLAHNPNYGGQIAKHRNYSTAAENVGRGYELGSLFQAFMKSSGHRHNIQNPAFSHVTVGCVRDASGQYWVTQNFWG
ncbi:CAP domain-containing protein [Actinospongicola halichondriae]|uniref:CAP domain-containing protein n=1 Tax=Actinospongicola halichondriae TaxID=3236844 RepID=UPI003D57AEF2